MFEIGLDLDSRPCDRPLVNMELEWVVPFEEDVRGGAQWRSVFEI